MAEQGLMCASCQKQTLHRRQEPNHILHFLVGALTCGFWWIVWFFIVATHNAPFLCTQCGAEYVPPKAASATYVEISPEELAIRRRKQNILAFAILGGVALLWTISILMK